MYCISSMCKYRFLYWIYFLPQTQSALELASHIYIYIIHKLYKIHNNAKISSDHWPQLCVRSVKCIFSNYAFIIVVVVTQSVSISIISIVQPSYIDNKRHISLDSHSPYRMRKLINSFRSFSRRIMPFHLTFPLYIYCHTCIYEMLMWIKGWCECI